MNIYQHKYSPLISYRISWSLTTVRWSMVTWQWRYSAWKMTFPV